MANIDSAIIRPRVQTASVGRAFAALIRADFTVLWRRRRSALMALLVPGIIIAAWHDIAQEFGGAFALASAITIGASANGLMGYAIGMARDRDRGVFQRLRVAPAPTWTIMTSRIAVQMVLLLLATLTVFVVGGIVDNIVLTPVEYILGTIAALVCGGVYLALGQALVGLVVSPEAVNAAARLIYIPLMVIGVIGELGVLGDTFGNIVRWSPYGTVKEMLSGAMDLPSWTGTTDIAVLVSLLYAAVFVFIGIRYFRWQGR